MRRAAGTAEAERGLHVRSPQTAVGEWEGVEKYPKVSDLHSNLRGIGKRQNSKDFVDVMDKGPSRRRCIASSCAGPSTAAAAAAAFLGARSDGF